MDKELSIEEIAKDIHEVISSNPDAVKKIGIFGSFAGETLTTKVILIYLLNIICPI